MTINLTSLLTGWADKNLDMSICGAKCNDWARWLQHITIEQVTEQTVSGTRYHSSKAMAIRGLACHTSISGNVTHQ